MAEVLGTGYALVAEFAGEMRARTLAYWKPSGIAPNIEWGLVGTPCEDVVQREPLPSPDRRERRSSRRTTALVEWGIESYLGVPLRGAGRPAPGPPGGVRHAADAPGAAEAVHLPDLRRPGRGGAASGCGPSGCSRESERRFRDLYEEAPIAYVYEDLESRFVGANRAAMRLLGHDAGGRAGHGRAVAASRRHAQTRSGASQEAFDAIGRGTARSRRRRAGAAAQGRRPADLGAVVVASPSRTAGTRARCSSTSPSAS